MRRKDRELTNLDEIKNIIDKADACHIAFAVNNVPYIVTMNFGYEWLNNNLVLYFHCAREGKKLDFMHQNSYVCFQMDIDHELSYNPVSHYCTMNYESIVGMGNLEEVTDIEERAKALDLLMAHYGHNVHVDYPPQLMLRTAVLRLKVTELSAKKKA